MTGSTFEFEDASDIISGMVASRREAVNGSRILQMLILDEPLCFDDDDLSARWERLCQGRSGCSVWGMKGTGEISFFELVKHVASLDIETS